MFNFKWHYLFFAIKLSVVIITLNAVLEELILFIVKRLGYDQRTKEAKISKTFLFSIYYFNASIAILLIGANLNHVPFLEQFFHGLYVDFTSQWYVVIGAQVVLNSFGDLIGPGIGYWINQLFLNISWCIDQGKCKNKKRYPS